MHSFKEIKADLAVCCPRKRDLTSCCLKDVELPTEFSVSVSFSFFIFLPFFKAVC